ncbi:MAG: hypothetical protein SOZ07_06930 [Prevotella sp.]|nr:hypothetical protein [Prevotella sp.]MDD7273657.1 hypothetical protein [Prevotellaceae bacterium]MDY3936372.1 hypothetical protein [Prevotella sp.]MDY4218374.1 hypothetical protein [Prevotella sp.]
MKATEQTHQQTERFLRKVAQKFPFTDEPEIMTDIHLRISSETGDLMAFDDYGEEITRCVIDQWIESKDEKFDEKTTNFLRKKIISFKDMVDRMGLMKPFSFVLENEEGEHIDELYLADSDTIILGDDLMKDLDKDLNDFFKQLFE